MARLCDGISIIADGDYTGSMSEVNQNDINLIITKVNNMANKINIRDKALKKANFNLEKFNLNLEKKVDERTTELNRTLIEVQSANKHIMESLRYAEWFFLRNLQAMRKSLMILIKA